MNLALHLNLGQDRLSHSCSELVFFPFISLQVYGPETTQKELFEGTVKDLVKDVLEGGNSLVFTYGATNAGKTFTFLGLYFFCTVFKLKTVENNHACSNFEMTVARQPQGQKQLLWMSHTSSEMWPFFYIYSCWYCPEFIVTCQLYIRKHQITDFLNNVALMSVPIFTAHYQFAFCTMLITFNFIVISHLYINVYIVSYFALLSYFFQFIILLTSEKWFATGGK